MILRFFFFLETKSLLHKIENLIWQLKTCLILEENSFFENDRGSQEVHEQPLQVFLF